jgi:hypothetical protein
MSEEPETLDSTEAARLEHLGVTAVCSECGGKGYHSYRYDTSSCGYCGKRGWVLTSLGEALVKLCQTFKVRSKTPRRLGKEPCVEMRH